MKKPDWLVKIQKWNKPLASIKLAVVIILSIAAISAWGTIVESQFNDARRAQETVFHSWYSYLAMFLLAVNLMAVMVDRLPWKKRHAPFLLAHVGILLLLAGSLLTRYWGIDGIMVVDIGKKSSRVRLPTYTDLAIYSGSSNVGSAVGFKKIYESSMDFFNNPPSEENPIKVEFIGSELLIDKYIPYARAELKTEKSDFESDHPALRFQMGNDRFQQTQWIASKGRPQETLRMGKAQIILARKGSFKYLGGNALVFEYDGDSEVLDYRIYSERLKKMTHSGKIKAGESIETGWMDLKLSILKYLPRSRERFHFTPVKRDVPPVTTAALRFHFKGQTYWMAMNSSVKLFSDSQFYYVSLGHRILNLDFSIRLKDFEVGRYQGTRRAATYASDVEVLDGKTIEGPINISMNEPLYYKDITFYQSSFSEDETGRAVSSVFSVNRDPGRWIKYIGSLMIVFGSILLFWRKRRTYVVHPKSAS